METINSMVLDIGKLKLMVTATGNMKKNDIQKEWLSYFVTLLLCCSWSKIWLLHLMKQNAYYLNGIPLIEEDNQQDLGVIISNDLHPHCHISHIVKKANQRIGLIRRCFTNLTSEKVSILYKSIVRPILEYGSTLLLCYFVALSSSPIWYGP
jgi:hypothetical protein